MTNIDDTNTDEPRRLADDVPPMTDALVEDDLEEDHPEASDEDADEADELEQAREHADPTRGDREVDGGDRISTDERDSPEE